MSNKSNYWQVRLTERDYNLFRELSDRENRPMSRIFRMMLYKRAEEKGIVPKEK